MSLEPGARLGHYEIEELLGRGGMGEVYRCRDPKLGRSVAIKKLSALAVPDPSRLARFLGEAKAVSSLNHPNILTVHEIGESDSGPYLVTELVDGTTVREKLRGGPLHWREALDLALQTTSGLAKSHDAGILHRDIKPENLMVTHDGLVKILDFGLAKLVDQGIEAMADSNVTATGMIVGTPGYLAPERLTGRDADARCDVFSLGVVMYEMLTGTNPFVRDNALATLHAIQTETPKPLLKHALEIPRELAQVVTRAIAKNRDERYANANELREALINVRAIVDSAQEWSGSGITSAPPRRGWLTPVVALGAVAIVVAWILLERGVFGPGRTPDDANTSAPRISEPGSRPGGPAGASTPGTTTPGTAMPGAPPTPGTATPTGAAPATNFTVDLPADKLGVAILPIADRSTDAELREAGIGRILTDAFVQILADHPKLYVIAPHRLAGVARSLGHTFEDTSIDLDLARRVAVDAQAGAMLTGTFSRLGTTYILSATLTELPSEVVVDQFRVQSQNVEALLADLSDGVRERLDQRFEVASATANERSMPTESIEAYAYYVRGDDLLQEGRWSEATVELRKSVELDPEMALAWSSLSCAYSFNGEDAKARDASNQAKTYLEHVNERERRWIELDAIWVNTQDADAYLAGMASFIRDYPDDRDSYFFAGLAEEYLRNDAAAALSWYEKAYALVPGYYPVTKSIVDCWLKLGKPDDAVAALQRYLDQEHVSEHARAQADARLVELREQS